MRLAVLAKNIIIKLHANCFSFFQSLSDDSLGNEQNQNVIPESVEQSKNKKHPVPWWITEDDSDEGNVLKFKDEIEIVGL
uniref:Uncharacterized protein n=1 Tax=Naja naja TaxID=35670 RepID=A0A8C6XAQ5_NAJNA